MGNGPRPQPLGKSRDLSQRPRTRTAPWGWSASPCVAQPVGEVQRHAQSCIRSALRERRMLLHVPATQEVAEVHAGTPAPPARRSGRVEATYDGGDLAQ